MKGKWYLSTFIICLALLGIISQQQIDDPNQEIVLQFSNDQVTDNEAENTITIVKKRLESAGATNIHVQEQQSGKLKITYFSHSDIASIKALFPKEKRLQIGFTSFNLDDQQKGIPLEENHVDYDLDVFEIKEAVDDYTNSAGKFAFQLKTDNDRFINTYTYLFTSSDNYCSTNTKVKTAYRLNRNTTLKIGSIAFIIPEVRAGPII